MRYDDRRILLCPPKTASRYCDQRVRGQTLPIQVDAARHAALHELPARVRRGRAVYAITRDPKSWYVSWWAHMQRQPDFYWRDLWGLRGRQVDFETALHAYMDLDRPCAGSPGPEVLLLREEQRRFRVGWFTVKMLWTVSKRVPLEPNPDVRWIRMDGERSLDSLLIEAGFTLHNDRDPVGAGRYQPVRWTAEMVALVEEYDGPMWRSILESSV